MGKPFGPRNPDTPGAIRQRLRREKQRGGRPPSKGGRPRTCLCGRCYKCERTVERRAQREVKKMLDTSTRGGAGGIKP